MRIMYINVKFKTQITKSNYYKDNDTNLIEITYFILIKV